MGNSYDTRTYGTIPLKGTQQKRCYERSRERPWCPKERNLPTAIAIKVKPIIQESQIIEIKLDQLISINISITGKNDDITIFIASAIKSRIVA